MLKCFRKYKRFIITLSLVAVMSLSCTLGIHAKAEPIVSYRTITEIHDWGAATSKILLDVGKPVKEGSVDSDTFSVFVSKSDQRLKTPFLEEGYRTVTKAYVCDKNGNPSKSGRYVTLEMEIGPSISLSSPINYYDSFNNWVDMNYTITLTKDITSGKDKISGLVINKCQGNIREIVDDFKLGKATFDDITLTYGDYSPEKDKKKNPLIIWLHGWGEGGTDPTIPLSANKSVNLASKEIQSYFGGAYVLVPQSPTFWMDGFTSVADGTSKYTESLMKFIKNYVSKNSDIDKSRIYIGGCSSGGYMTMLMIRDYPKYFAAAYPVCEGLMDEYITEKDIDKLKNTPIWFVTAKADETLPPDKYTVPTYERLIKGGAKDVQLTLFNDVRDTTGLYKNPDGSPFTYNGHFSWIYAYNNECETTIDGKKITLMEWMASKKNKNSLFKSYKLLDFMFNKNFYKWETFFF